MVAPVSSIRAEHLAGPLARLRWPAFLPRGLAFYVVFGGTAATVNLETGWLLYGSGPASHIPYWFATALAATAGLVTNFGLNYLYNFKYRNRSIFSQFFTFGIVSGIGVLLTAAIATAVRVTLYRFFGPFLYLGGAAIRLDLVAHVTAVGAVFFYSYPAHKAISFNVGLRARLWQLVSLRDNRREQS
jgi:putative flippase GtrA